MKIKTANLCRLGRVTYAYLIAIWREINAHASESDFEKRLTAHSQYQVITHNLQSGGPSSLFV